MAEAIHPGAVPGIADASLGPRVRPLDVNDISYALTMGMRDFRRAPLFGLFFGGVYAVGGMLLTYFVVSAGMLYLAYPMAAGFALIAPLVAVGLYEVSRQIEQGQEPTWSAVLNAIPHHGARELGYMALVAVFGMIVWIYAAGFIYALFFGLRPVNAPDLVSTALTTPAGIVFFMFGNVIGTMIAASLFAVSVVSYPMLIDRDIDFVTAMITSVRAVMAAPYAMAGWAFFIGFMLLVAILPMFLGLFVILPLLGHATWHIYRRVVEPETRAP